MTRVLSSIVFAVLFIATAQAGWGPNGTKLCSIFDRPRVDMGKLIKTYTNDTPISVIPWVVETVLSFRFLQGRNGRVAEQALRTGASWPWMIKDTDKMMVIHSDNETLI